MNICCLLLEHLAKSAKSPGTQSNAFKILYSSNMPNHLQGAKIHKFFSNHTAYQQFVRFLSSYWFKITNLKPHISTIPAFNSEFLYATLRFLCWKSYKSIYCTKRSVRRAKHWTPPPQGPHSADWHSFIHLSSYNNRIASNPCHAIWPDQPELATSGKQTTQLHCKPSQSKQKSR